MLCFCTVAGDGTSGLSLHQPLLGSMWCHKRSRLDGQQVTMYLRTRPPFWTYGTYGLNCTCPANASQNHLLRLYR